MTDRNESLKIIFLDSAEQKLFIFEHREKRISHIFMRKIGNLKSQELIFVFVKKNTDRGQPRPGDPWQEKIYERKHNRKWTRIKRGNCWKEHLFYFQFIFFWNLPFGLSSLILLLLKYPILVFENFLTTVRMFQFRIFQFCHR